MTKRWNRATGPEAGLVAAGAAGLVEGDFAGSPRSTGEASNPAAMHINNVEREKK